MGRRTIIPQSLYLSQIIDNPIAIYSTAKLSNELPLGAIRLRRDSDQLEADIGFLNNEYDVAAETSHLSGANGFDRTYYNQIIANNDFDQSTVANQPGVLSGVLTGDGSNDTFQNSLPTTAGDFTYSFSMKTSVSGSRTHCFDFGAAAQSSGLHFDYDDGAFALRLYWNGSGANNINIGLNGDYTDGVWRHFMCTRNGTTIELWVDNVSQGTSTLNTSFTTLANLSIFSGNAIIFPLNGNMDNIIVAHSAANAAQRLAIFNANKKV